VFLSFDWCSFHYFVRKSVLDFLQTPCAHNIVWMKAIGLLRPYFSFRPSELRAWLERVESFDFWDFNLWPVAASLFANGCKGAEARNDARVGNLAKHEWILVYAINGDTTMIPESLLKDIKKTLRDKHNCASGAQDAIDKAMLRPNDFKDGEVWLMVKLGYTNPPRDLVKRRLDRMDAAALKMERVHICGDPALSDMSPGARKNDIRKTLAQNGTFRRQQDEWDEQARTNRNQDSNSAVCKTTLACTTLGSSSAMLTIVMDVKTMTQSAPMSSLNIVNRTSAGQGT